MERTIRVTGTGKVSVKPDLTIISLDFSNVLPTYEEALKATMEDADYIAAATSFDTNFLDHTATTALIEQQQEFAESLGDDFWSF